MNDPLDMTVARYIYLRMGQFTTHGLATRVDMVSNCALVDPLLSTGPKLCMYQHLQLRKVEIRGFKSLKIQRRRSPGNDS